MLKIYEVESIEALAGFFGLMKFGNIIQNDIDFVENECDWYERKRRDAEVLAFVGANSYGNILELGTSHGRSTAELAVNLHERGRVYTINILEEQVEETSGKLITHVLAKEEVGAYYRGKNIANVVQIFADTMSWTPTTEVSEGVVAAFIDAAHDSANVINDSRLAYNLLRDNGFLIWHDFNPKLRSKFGWIDSVMKGVESFANELDFNLDVIHLRNSFMGIARVSRPTADSGQKSSATGGVVLTARQRYLVGFSAYPDVTDVYAANSAWISRLKAEGFDVEGICLTVDPPARNFPWSDLDRLWREKDKQLLALYDKLIWTVKSLGITSFINYNGINLHPDFVRDLKKLCFTVYCCFDDPESSLALSKPVAPAYDLVMVGNIAELDSYRTWGCRHVEWLPIGWRASDVGGEINEHSILNNHRSIDVSIVCERVSPQRRVRLDQFSRAFPQGVYRGAGWPLGLIDEKTRLGILSNTKIGPNFHNSTGPVNIRTFATPINGAMLLCDNSDYLSKIFDLGNEAIGFDYADEAIFKARFFLKHEKRRREIAAAGWYRARKDYSEAACFRRIADSIENVRAKGQTVASFDADATNAPKMNIERQITRLGSLQRHWKEIVSEMEAFTLSFLERFVRPGMRWLEIGSHSETYSELFARRATKSGFGCSWHPRLQHSATHLSLSEDHEQFSAGAFTFFGSREELGKNISFPDMDLNYKTNNSEINVSDSELNKTSVSNFVADVSRLISDFAFDVLKIDVSGCEAFMLKKIESHFLKYRPIILINVSNRDMYRYRENVGSVATELVRLNYSLVSVITLQPFRSDLEFLAECGSFATRQDALAVPRELFGHTHSLKDFANSIPSSFVKESRVFSTVTDWAIWRSHSNDGVNQIRLRALNGQEIKIRAGTSDATVLWDVFHFQYHRPSDAKGLGGPIVIFDLGANIGLSSADLGYQYPEATIVAVELDYQNSQLALANTRFLGDRCEVVNAGIWIYDGSLSYSGTSEQGFSISLTGSESANGKSVRVATLMRERGISKIDYVKMDIEGAELNVLLDSSDWLHAVRCIKVELHKEEDFEPVWSLLEDSGFRCTLDKKHYCSIEGWRA